MRPPAAPRRCPGSARGGTPVRESDCTCTPIGVKRAALHPVVGAEKLVRFWLGGSAKVEETIAWELTVVNGSPGLAVYVGGEFDGVMAARVEDARIAGLYFVRNPEKLTHLTSGTPLAPR
ncbi:hypothetical protein [Streptomyces sp. NPDC016172]|uniref:hypothetical protein n=1 Tax=Streptomyces sp. NPDC016172 TaxID=3364964 RepID=UPI0036FBB3D3